MTIIVTGGAGFIGSNFVFHMLKNIPITESYVLIALHMPAISQRLLLLWIIRISVL